MSTTRAQARVVRMEAARRETRHHLDLVRRQIEGRAERITVTEKAKARSLRRGGSRWTRSDELLLQVHVDRLTFERRSEIEALTRKLTRQDAAIEAFRARHDDGSHGPERGRCLDDERSLR
ncbi:hypothetical protein N5K21_26300 [Rhizobium pusense]|uniref:hypothetical protein n=1 Tax=Agrobacterium pusense TaxID=648995 RepID=UPI00244815FE|nr:hypothetical protein [Agrobacterium pusense]MDH2092237.1 hypothetical protein [Agrobacterium pusense]